MTVEIVTSVELVFEDDSEYHVTLRHETWEVSSQQAIPTFAQHHEFTAPFLADCLEEVALLRQRAAEHHTHNPYCFCDTCIALLPF